MILLIATILILYLAFSLLSIFSQSATIAVIAYSALSSTTFFVYYVYNAADVALTEISIGVFLTFFFFYIVHYKCGSTFARNTNYYEIVFIGICCIAIFCILLYLAYLLEIFSLQNEYSSYYLQSYGETHISNIITAILASYRGFDTMGETLIIATSSLGISTILKSKPRKSNKNNIEK